MVMSRSIQLLDNSYSIVYLLYPSTHPSDDRHFGSSHVLAVVNSAAANIWVQVSFEMMVPFHTEAQKYD